MANLTKNELSKNLESLRGAINFSQSDNGYWNKSRYAEIISKHARTLMTSLEMPLTKGAQSIVLDCESQIDRATSAVEWLNA